MSSIFLLFDAGPRTGLGHWYRCLALADQLRSAGSVSLVTPPLPHPLRQQLARRAEPAMECADWSETEVLRLLEQTGSPTLVVLDLIATPARLVTALRERGITVASIGGAGPGRDSVDLRIDGMIPRPAFHNTFRGRSLHVGPQFVILRETFATTAPRFTAPTLHRVLVILGGDAAAQGTEVAGSIATARSDLVVDLILGPLAVAPRAKPQNLQIHQDPRQLVELMAAADVAVCSGGMTAFELCRVGVPMLFHPLTPLQSEAAQAFVRHGVGRLSNGGDWRDLLGGLGDPGIRKVCAEAGQGLIDGRGVERVAQLLHSELLSLPCSPLCL